MITSMQKKSLTKFSIFLIETLSKLKIEENSLNLIKDSYEKPSVSIKYSGERLNTFLLRSGITQGCPRSALLFNIVSEVLYFKPRSKIIFVQIYRQYDCLM